VSRAYVVIDGDQCVGVRHRLANARKLHSQHLRTVWHRPVKADPWIGRVTRDAPPVTLRTLRDDGTFVVRAERVS